MLFRSARDGLDKFTNKAKQAQSLSIDLGIKAGVKTDAEQKIKKAQKETKDWLKSLNEVQDDINAIQADPLYSQAEKDQRSIARFQEGLRFLRDEFKAQFEVARLLPSSVINSFYDQLSKFEIRFETGKALGDLQRLKTDIKAIQLTGGLLNENTIQQEINTTSNAFRALAQSIAAIQMMPVAPGMEGYRAAQVKIGRAHV